MRGPASAWHRRTARAAAARVRHSPSASDAAQKLIDATHRKASWCSERMRYSVGIARAPEPLSRGAKDEAARSSALAISPRTPQRRPVGSSTERLALSPAR
jgi:hypothetical protein